MRNLMNPIRVGNRTIKFAFDKEGNEYGYYAEYGDEVDMASSISDEVKMTKEHIAVTIDKMVKCGKTLPQKDRIRNSKNPDEETMKVLSETIKLWWDIFSRQDIGAETWEKATDKALILNGIPRLDVSMISPTLMQAALQEVQKDFLYEQQTRAEMYKQESQGELRPTRFPEVGRLVKYHMAKHKHPLLCLQDADKVMEWAKGGGWPEDVIAQNVIQLRVYYLFAQHAKRDGEPNPLRISLDKNKHAVLELVG